MTRTHSSRLAAADGRYLTPLEAEHQTLLALQSEQRLAASAALCEREGAIVKQAVDDFCDAVAGFEAPPGSVRRSKGLQDGRILLRYLAQSIREASPEPMAEKVLSWYVGHLDDANVTGQHVEVFFHFLFQCARKEVPAPLHALVEEAVGPAVSLCRQAAAAGSLKRHHQRLAQAAVDRLFAVCPAAGAKYGPAAASKGKRDFGFLLEELARLLHDGDPRRTRLRFTTWLSEALVVHVNYPAEVWHWSMLCIQEAVVRLGPPEVGLRTAPLLDGVARNAGRLVAAAGVGPKALACGELAAHEMLRSRTELGLLTEGEFRKEVATAGRRLLLGLAVFGAAGSVEEWPQELADLWTEDVVPALPSPAVAPAFLAALAAVVRRELDGPRAELLAPGLEALRGVQRRAEAAARLAAVADPAADRAAEWCQTNLPAFATQDGHARRAGRRDLRLLLGKIITLLPAGTAETQGVRLRKWLAAHVLPNLTAFPAQAVREAFAALGREVTAGATSADARLAAAFLEEAGECALVYGREVAAGDSGRALREAARRAATTAPGERRAAEAAGVRDGEFLLQQLVRTAAAGPQAMPALREWFREEIARHSRLPGGVLVEFVRALREGLPGEEFGRLLADLEGRAAGFAAGWRLFAAGDRLAEEATRAVFGRLPDYARKVGDAGRAAAARDNAITIRGLAAHLLFADAPTEAFAAWWRDRVERHIVTRPADLFRVNREELERAFSSVLDSAESAAAAALLGAAYRGL